MLVVVAVVRLTRVAQECMMDLIVADGLASALRSYDGTNMNAELAARVTALAFRYFRVAKPRYASHCAAAALVIGSYVWIVTCVCRV